MKRNDLDELEGKQIEKSWKLNDTAEKNNTDGKGKEMDDAMKSVIAKLPAYLQERAVMLWEELMRLNVRLGVAKRLMGMGHMGALNDPIWRYIYKLNTGRKSNIRDKGSWLVKCLLNDRLVRKV